MTSPLLTRFLVKTISDAISQGDFPLADLAFDLLEEKDPAAGRDVRATIGVCLAINEAS